LDDDDEVLENKNSCTMAGGEPTYLVMRGGNPGYIGFTYFGGYVYTKKALTKYRFCLILIAPFVFLSIILNAISGALGFYAVPLYNVPLSVFIIFNSIGSSVDILGLTLVLLQVPKDANLTMNGMRTYWKHHR
jgi:Putative zincin peptidase